MARSTKIGSRIIGAKLFMPLVLAVKNKDTIVVASDTDGSPEAADRFGQFIPMPNRTILLIAGNLDAVRTTVINTVMPKVHPEMSAAGLAQLLQAALVVDVVPNLAQLKGRVELIVAGMDKVRHIEEPALYYLDSAQDFYLQVVQGDATAAGSTSEISQLMVGHGYGDYTADQLKVLAKECMSTTKLRWPAALSSHVRLAIVTAESTLIQDY